MNQVYTEKNRKKFLCKIFKKKKTGMWYQPEKALICGQSESVA